MLYTGKKRVSKRRGRRRKREEKEEGGEGGGRRRKRRRRGRRKRKIEIPSGSNCITKNTACVLDIRYMLHCTCVAIKHIPATCPGVCSYHNPSIILYCHNGGLRGRRGLMVNILLHTA